MNKEKEYDADYEDNVGDAVHRTNDTVEVTETDKIGADGAETHTRHYETHADEPEPEQAATLGEKSEKKRTNVAFAAVYAMGLIVIVIIAAVVLIYWKSGGTSGQNANMTVDKRRASNSSEPSDPTYEEAASLIKPSSSPSTLPPGNGQTPLPNGQMPPPANPTNSILGDQTTGYGLGGSDYVYPKPPLPSGSAGTSSGGGSASAPKFNSASSGGARGGNSSSSGGGDASEIPVQNIRPLPSPSSQVADAGSSGFSENKTVSPIDEILSGATRGGGNSSGVSTSLYYHNSPLSISEQRSENSNLKRGQTLPFATVLPVRMLGALHSLQNQALARMELTRAVSGNGFFLPRGTQFVGRISGGTANRIFVTILGYIDNSSGNLVSVSGDLLNIDGSIGIAGKRQQLGSRWKKIFSPAVDIARQFGLAYLQSRSSSGTIAVIPQSAINPVLGETGRENQNNAVFVSVAAGATAYIFINGLPPSDSDATAQKVAADNTVTSAAQDLRILTGDAADMQRNLERLSPELRQLAARPNN